MYIFKKSLKIPISNKKPLIEEGQTVKEKGQPSNTNVSTKHYIENKRLGS